MLQTRQEKKRQTAAQVVARRIALKSIEPRHTPDLHLFRFNSRSWASSAALPTTALPRATTAATNTTQRGPPCHAARPLSFGSPTRPPPPSSAPARAARMGTTRRRRRITSAVRAVATSTVYGANSDIW